MFKKQPFIYSAFADSTFILAPPFVCVALVFLFYPYFNTQLDVQPYQWFILVMCVDVSHVYSTAYRTYFDPNMLQNRKTLLLLTPLLTAVLGFILHLYNPDWFWRLLAYLAVFHFVRQQYGFFSIYARKQLVSKLHKNISIIAIYGSTLYPVLVWHVSGARNFTWFIQNDFILFYNTSLIPTLTATYILILMLYFILEIKHIVTHKTLNIPKNLVLIGTAMSWYFAIVYFNSDLVFTLINVVSHGVPYMALIWMYGAKKLQMPQLSGLQKLVFSTKGLLVFVLLLLLFAFVEETLWDSLIWHDYPQYFNFTGLWGTWVDPATKALLVSLLTVPQVTHYLLDGFIWKQQKH